MLFVTVGTDLPFNRMVAAVDRWAGETNRTDVFAQIGETDWRPAHIEFKSFLEPDEFRERFNAASVVVAHAGMGTILSALHFGKPILVMPRRASLGEQRNEHQLATARRLQAMGRIHVAFDEDELIENLNRLSGLTATSKIEPYANRNLINGIADFIAAGR